MPDTGAPWEIPYLDGTELVRNYPDFSEDVADAVAAGLDAAGGLVAVKSAIFTGTQVVSGVAIGGNFAITDLSITHEVADAANKLIISAFVGGITNNDTAGEPGIAVHDGTGLIAIGGADGSRTRVTAGGRAGTGVANLVTSKSFTIVHTPGAGSKTYTLRAVSISDGTKTIYINRSSGDANNGRSPRTASSLVIQEVKV